MLEQLRLRGLGVIDDAELELAPGLTVLTGETGAGKTMVVTGLGLLLGDKADAGRVRPGASAAFVDGRVRLPAGHPALAAADAAGAELDEGDLLLSRRVSGEGRTRRFLGGRPVPLQTLASVGEHLVAVHGQHDQRRLLSGAHQRAALDRFAGPGLAAALAAYATGYDRLRVLDAELDELTTRARERAQEADLLRFGITEIEAVAPEADEDVALTAEESRLSHADLLRVAATQAHGALLGGLDDDAASDAATLVAAARRTLEGVRDHDAELAGLADRLAEASYLLSDIGADVASYAASVESDPRRLDAVHDRRAALAGLTRKYGTTVAAVISWASGAGERLLTLEGDDERIGALGAERSALVERLGGAAQELSRLRATAGTVFAAAVTVELQALAMPHAQVSVEVSQRDDATGLLVGRRRLAYGPSGVDDVEFLLAPHPDAAPRPLGKGASGGELSRVMLAVEVVFAGVDPVPTFVFDEVDAGVGGRAAVEIGRRLARLAQHAQVLVVTHLPQVAAFADRHLLVAKSSDGTVTRSGVTELDDAGRVQELSRMLAGLEGSDTALAHARELLETARTDPARA